jgi:hypothetical protein
MEKKPSLYQADCGPDNTVAWSNKRWKAAHNLIGLVYWDRVWIFQEIVLASKATLVCGSRKLDWKIVEYAGSRLGYLRINIRNTGMKRPSFLSKWAWSVISSDIYINWESLLFITNAKYPSLLEDEELGEKGPKWHISLYGLSLRATDPKDYIFGLLGVNPIKIKPNYNEKTSVRDVYLDYVLAWLDDWRTDACGSICELFFLVWSGSAFSRKNSTLSSWTPSFPGFSGLHGLSAIDSGAASHGVLGQEIPSCSIEGSTLFASSLRPETVTVAEETISEGFQVESISNFFRTWFFVGLVILLVYQPCRLCSGYLSELCVLKMRPWVFQRLKSL